MPAILLLCLSALCFGYSVIAFLGRGPLLSSSADVDSAKGTARVWVEYRAIALAFLGLGLCFLSYACMLYFQQLWLAWLSVALSAVVVSFCTIFYLRALR